MSLDRLRNLAKNKADDEDNLIETFYVIMKEFGYTIQELKEIPIPTYRYLIKMLEKESKTAQKALRRKK